MVWDCWRTVFDSTMSSGSGMLGVKTLVPARGTDMRYCVTEVTGDWLPRAMRHVLRILSTYERYMTGYPILMPTERFLRRLCQLVRIGAFGVFRASHHHFFCSVA